MQCTDEKESEYVPVEFTPPRFTDDIYVSILYEDIYYKALYPEQTSILPEKALEVGTVESQTYLKISKPYSNMQTNCLDLPVGSKLYILDDTLYAYNDTTETYWMFSKKR